MNLRIFALIIFGILASCKNEPKAVVEEKAKQPNILFLAIDDLRPELGVYGSDIAITPNIDALANDGLRFNNAYCQQAICSPSRASLMTGARPETIQVIENFTYFRDKNPDIATLPQHFKANGYESVYTGKIYHGKYNDPELSWSRTPVQLDKKDVKFGFKLPENIKMQKENSAAMIAKYGENALRNGLGKGPAYEFADFPDNAYEDGFNTDMAIATMKDMLQKNPDKPFFLGMGMKKPHLDWIAPKKYWDLYSESDIKLAEHEQAPKDGATMGLHASFELRARADIPKQGDISPEQAIKLKHAYLASISYVDAQIGKLLRELKSTGLDKNTIIVIWGDHGWHLGDQRVWGKHTLFENALKSALIIKSPYLNHEVQKVVNIVETVDLYPTILELCALEPNKKLDGESLAGLMENTTHNFENVAYSYYNKGISMRTENYRFTKYFRDEKPVLELYDRTKYSLETKNIAAENDNLVEELLPILQRGNPKLYTDTSRN